MYESNKLLTIGQFASLHGINKKTLMWYDEIGLFHPARIHPENGYRYYSYRQSALLETILLLRELDVSISEIQAFMALRSAESLQQLFNEKIRKLDDTIAHFRNIRSTLCHHKQNMETLLSMDLSKITLVQKQMRHMATVAIDRTISYDESVERVLAKTKKYRLRRLHDASYGSMIASESLYRKDFDDYSMLFIELPTSVCTDDGPPSLPTKKAGLHIQPRGAYLRAFYQGDWQNMSAKYEEILEYAKHHRMQLTGFSYEKILNETVTDRMEDMIVQIEIPICMHAP